jgi:hypothetical protein
MNYPQTKAALPIRQVVLPDHVSGPLDGWLGTEARRQIEREMRSPAAVMTPKALSAVKCSDLSFSRILIRQMARERWQIGTPDIEVDHDGNGHLIYRINARERSFTLVVRANWDGAEKAGRRMDTTADLIASLMIGAPDRERIAVEIASMSVPFWGGRTDDGSYGFTGANRSQRLFDYVVEELSQGRQPEAQKLAEGGGYIIRNAGFYGNGRAGAANWAAIGPDHPFATPYAIDLFLMYMWRQVGLDYADAVASARNPGAARLSRNVRRYIGVGNSSGLGMTVALVRWPQWIGTWCLSREVAIAYCKLLPTEGVTARRPLLRSKLDRAIDYYEEVAGPEHILPSHQKIVEGLRRLKQRLTGHDIADWAGLCAWTEANVDSDTLEQLHSLLIDIHPEVTDFLEGLLPRAMQRRRQVMPGLTLGDLRRALDEQYGWALHIDRSTPEGNWHFWYHSEEAGEQRRGERHIDAGSEFETFVDVVGPIQSLAKALQSVHLDDAISVGRFLLNHPEFAYIVSRIGLALDEPYGEIQGNLVHKDFLPVHVIRFFLSVLGFESGSPRSVAWVRGVLLQGAPLPDEIGHGQTGEWSMPTISEIWNQ